MPQIKRKRLGKYLTLNSNIRFLFFIPSSSQLLFCEPLDPCFGPLNSYVVVIVGWTEYSSDDDRLYYFNERRRTTQVGYPSSLRLLRPPFCRPCFMFVFLLARSIDHINF